MSVCALTFKRPQGLRRLLDGLARLELPEEVEVCVVIVDNDPEGSGRSTVQDFARWAPFPVRYEIEPQRGIPFGRNRAIDSAEGADFIAFIDDDEVPDADWLLELLRAQRATGADVVHAPVRPLFEEPPPQWVIEGRFFERPRFADLAPISWATTSNVLIAGHLVPVGSSPFPEWMGLNGGDDTHFFQRVHQSGHRMVWSDTAWVTETIPASRVDPRWMWRRQYRRGNTLSLCLRDLSGSPVRVFRRAVQGLFHIAGGGALALVAPLRGKAALVAAIDRVCFGAGMLVGLTGARYEEYGTIHGR